MVWPVFQVLQCPAAVFEYKSIKFKYLTFKFNSKLNHVFFTTILYIILSYQGLRFFVECPVFITKVIAKKGAAIVALCLFVITSSGICTLYIQ